VCRPAPTAPTQILTLGYAHRPVLGGSTRITLPTNVSNCARPLPVSTFRAAPWSASLSAQTATPTFQPGNAWRCVHPRLPTMPTSRRTPACSPAGMGPLNFTTIPSGGVFEGVPTGSTPRPIGCPCMPITRPGAAWQCAHRQTTFLPTPTPISYRSGDAFRPALRSTPPCSSARTSPSPAWRGARTRPNSPTETHSP
jgi:hypothetical protein